MSVTSSVSLEGSDVCPVPCRNHINGRRQIMLTVRADSNVYLYATADELRRIAADLDGIADTIEADQ